MRRQTADSPLHTGRAPKWLFERMHRLAGPIIQLIVADRGPGEMLRRLSDPLWFQAFGCVLGFDWHSSGLTTVTCGAIKEAYRRIGPDLGIHAAGGKGAHSRATPEEIARTADARSLAGDQLIYASRMSAKVDSAAVQDGYQIYTHHFFFTDQNDWCVVQQGMNDANGYARRYHWLGNALEPTLAGGHLARRKPQEGGHPARLESLLGSSGQEEAEAGKKSAIPRTGEELAPPKAGRMPALLWSFICEPHSGVASPPARGPDLLNMVAAEAEASRRQSAELAGMNPDKLLREITAGPSLFMPAHHDVRAEDINPGRLAKVLRTIHERPPADFEGLLGAPGVGPATVRSLALIAELIYGTPACRRDITKRWSPSDPGTFSYAVGGKDGHPFPVDRQAYDESIALLESAVRRAKIDPAGKDQALFRLTHWMGRW
ncbi:MAG: DUF763 domain-containing protein [Phycisphaerae bacterium]|nr:DUF763 domain-containing protein [Phycisphaerae bacterium]